MNSSLSKFIGIVGSIVKYAHSFKSEFLKKAQETELKTLISEYTKAREAIEKAKLRVKVELEEVEKELENYVLKRLLDEADKLPLGDLIELAEKIGIHKELLGRLPSDRVLNSLSTLDLDKLVLLYRDTWKYKGQALKELIRRLKTPPCEIVENYVAKVRSSPTYGKEDALMLFEEFHVRIECPKLLETLFYDVLWVYRVYHGKDVLAAFKRVVDKAIKNFDSMPCRKHLELLSALKRSHNYVLLYTDRQEVLRILNEYAEAVLKKFDTCTVQDVVYDMSELKEPLYTYADKTMYTEAVLKVLARDAGALRPSIMAGIIDVLCKLGQECCCLVLRRLGLPRIVAMLRRALQDVVTSGVREIDSTSLAASLARVLDSCRDLVGLDAEAVFASICHDVEDVWKLGLGCVQSPSSTLELINCIYWLHVLKRDIVDKWCTQPLELPSIDFEKVSELIRRDLEGGADPWKLRDTIKKLENVDEALSNNFRKVFDKERKKLGITLKTAR